VIDNVLLLVLLLGGLVAAPALLRRARGATPDGIRVLGRTALHKQAVVAVVAVGERRLLVGAGEHGVQLLAELDPTADDTPQHRTDVPGDTLEVHRIAPSIDDRMDAVATTSTSAVASTLPAELAALPLVGVPAGPGIGLVDRLRAMTVRTPTQGRPIDVLLRR
jgi:flagellar biogenesis protein FliO